MKKCKTELRAYSHWWCTTQNYLCAMLMELMSRGISLGVLWRWFRVKNILNRAACFFPGICYTTQKIFVSNSYGSNVSWNQVNNAVEVAHGEKKCKNELRISSLRFCTLLKIFCMQCLWSQCALKSAQECCWGGSFWKMCKTEVCFSSQRFGILLKISLFATLRQPLFFKISSECSRVGSFWQMCKTELHVPSVRLVCYLTLFYVQCLCSQALKTAVECFVGGLWWYKYKTEICVPILRFGILQGES